MRGQPPNIRESEIAVVFCGLNEQDAKAIAIRDSRNWRVEKRDGKPVRYIVPPVRPCVMASVDDGVVTAARSY